jgi:DNA-directed RNA polymerase specialized sigma24 family protein
MQIDDLLAAARHLPEAELALVRAVYERGLPLKALAAAANTRSGRLHDRLQRIVARLRSPLFRGVLREMPHWPDVRRGVAQMVILRGASQRHTAAALKVSLHRVRLELERIRALAEEMV